MGSDKTYFKVQKMTSSVAKTRKLPVQIAYADRSEQLAFVP